MALSMELADQIERSEIAYVTNRMEAIRDRPGNPEGIEIARFGGATCFYSRTMPWGGFNSVKGLRNDVADELPSIVDFYRERDRKPQFELVPGLADGRLMGRLSELGFRQTGFNASMYAEPLQVPAETAGGGSLVVRELQEDEFRAYATVHCRGFGMSDDGIPHVEANNRVLHGRPGWKFYLAFWEDRLAGAAVLHAAPGVASLTFAASMPDLRNKGVHSALLRRRLSDAARAGCRMAVAQCAFLSQSHRNMEKAGMALGYVRASWS